MSKSWSCCPLTGQTGRAGCERVRMLSPARARSKIPGYQRGSMGSRSESKLGRPKCRPLVASAVKLPRGSSPPVNGRLGSQPAVPLSFRDWLSVGKHRRQLFQHSLFWSRHFLPYAEEASRSLGDTLRTMQYLSLERAPGGIAHSVCKGLDIVLPGIDQRPWRWFCQPPLEQHMADVALPHPQLDGTGRDRAPLLVIDGAVSPGNGDQGDQGQRGQCLAVDIVVLNAVGPLSG